MTPPEQRVEFEVVREAWTAVRVHDADGTVLEFKPVITDLKRTDQRDADGCPVYRVTAVVVARPAP